MLQSSSVNLVTYGERPVLHLGTLCLTRTLILLSQLLNVTLGPSSFPHTSILSAFEVSYKNVRYKSTVTLVISYYLYG